MKNKRVKKSISRTSSKIDLASFELDYFVNAMPGFGRNNIEDLLELSKDELRTLIALIAVAKDNLIDMKKHKQKVLELTEYKSVKNQIKALVDKGILIKSSIRQLFLIDASYFLIGNPNRIHQLHEAFKNGSNPRDLVEKHEKVERPDWQINITEAKIEEKRKKLS